MSVSTTLKSFRFLYGIDPVAHDLGAHDPEEDGEDFRLILLDHDACDVVARLRFATTYGEVVETILGTPFHEYNWELEELGDKLRDRLDPFDAAEEQDEDGMLYRNLLATETRAAFAVSDVTQESGQRLLNEVRAQCDDGGCFRCYLRDDGAAELLGEVWSEAYGTRPQLLRDDRLVEWVRVGDTRPRPSWPLPESI